MGISMRPREVTSVLRTLVHAGVYDPVYISGPPGCGKTEMVTQFAEEEQMELIVSHPAVDDPSDAKGLPGFDGEFATFKPHSQLRRAIQATKPTIWFFDDFGHATMSVQASYMQLMQSRWLDRHRLPDCVMFVMASNRLDDKAGVHRMITPVKSRFIMRMDMEVSHADWDIWAVPAGIHPDIRFFLHHRPDLLMTFNPKRADDDHVNPRVWAKWSKVLYAYEKMGGMSEEMLPKLAAGTLGDGVSVEFVSFKSCYSRIPDIDNVLAHPDKAEVPTAADVIHATIGMLVERVRKCSNTKELKKTAAAFVAYVSRFKHAAHSVLAVSQALRSQGEKMVTEVPEVQKWLSDNSAYFRPSCK